MRSDVPALPRGPLRRRSPALRPVRHVEPPVGPRRGGRVPRRVVGAPSRDGDASGAHRLAQRGARGEQERTDDAMGIGERIQNAAVSHVALAYGTTSHKNEDLPIRRTMEP